MPRPKVRPEDRQRSSKACLPCQASKIRCDSHTPCTSCLRRGRSSACKYAESRRPRLPREDHHARSVRFAPPFRTLPHSSRTSSNAENIDGTTRARSERAGQSEDFVNALSVTTVSGPPEATESSLLLSSKGEKVFIGETSSLSFLQFLQGIMKQYMGPSSFTENGPLNVMLEADTNVARNVVFEENVASKQELIQTYFEVSSGFLDLFDKGDILELLRLEDSTRENISREELAILYLVIAIGGQCRGSSASDIQYATKYFSIGQQYAFEGMLKDPSINMLRAFLLMAFYMLGACHRNAAYMYLGVASKSAAALGLHVGMQARGLSSEETGMRWRLYKSLCVFDLVVSVLLGRTASSIPTISKDLISPDKLNSRSTAVTAAYNGSLLLEEIVQELKKADNNSDISTAERLLRDLREWIKGLPSHFRQWSPTNKTNSVFVDREKAIANIHVSCIYYFAIILTTRSFLISHLMSRLKESSIIPSESSASSHKEQMSPQLAQVCISAATYTANMCEQAMRSGLLLSNMCIIKAWAFAAGLILGFSLFVYDDIESRTETETAFQNAKHVLQYLSSLSPLAKQYNEILTSFAEAIANHRRQTSSARQRIADRYIDYVFDLDNIVGTPNQNSTLPARQGLDIDSWNPSLNRVQARSFLPDAVGDSNRDLQSTDDSDVEIADDVDLDGFNVLPFDEGGNFSIDYEPFGLLLDGI